MINVPNKKILDVLPNTPEDKEYALVKDEGKIYQYSAAARKWAPIKVEGEGLKISLYDINQNIFAQLEPMTDESLRNAQAEIYKFLGEDFTTFDLDFNYWALICWPKHYITIFHHKEDSEEELSDIIMEVLEGLGQIKDITVSEDGKHVEIWITDDESTECYVLFYYSNGVVEGYA